MKTSVLGIEKLHFIRLVYPLMRLYVYRSQPQTRKGVQDMSKYRLKKDATELQEYLQFRRRGSRVDAKKGKGAKYKRSREKNKARKQENE